MGRIKLPSFETVVYIAITEVIVNAIWYGITTLSTIQSMARDWGFVIISVVVIVVLGWYLGRRNIDKKVVSTDNGQQKSSPSWLEQELSSDLQRVYEGMRGRTTRWDFSGIYNREPYFDVFVELTNTTIFTFSLRSLSGFMKIAGEPCTNPPQVSTRFDIKRDKPADIRVRQPITPETVAIIQDAGNSNKEIQFHLGEVVFEIKNATNRYEQYKPYLTGGIYDIVPKDGLKLEPLRQNIGLMIIEGKEVLDKLKAVEANWSGNDEATAIIYFEAWCNKVSNTLQNPELNRYYPLWYKDAGGLDHRKSHIPDYIKACKAGLDRLESILSD